MYFTETQDIFISWDLLVRFVDHDFYRNKRQILGFPFSFPGLFKEINGLYY